MPPSPSSAPSADLRLTPAKLALDSDSVGIPNVRGAVFTERQLTIAAVIFILLAGLALRIMPLFGVPDRLTVDENLYITNVSILKAAGPLEYASLIETYVRAQSRMQMVMLPPTRCVYIMLGWAWDAMFHTGPRMALRQVAAMFSALSLLLTGWFAYRLGGVRIALVVSALMAVAPLELVMAHRELVDGVFAFWALLSLWLLWEVLQHPGKLGWLGAYAGSIAIMVLTKENAFFATVALGGILCAALLFPQLHLGKAHWGAFAATFAGGAMGVAVLISLAGSPRLLIAVYELLVSKAEKMDFAYESGGGPWFRYIVDIMLVSPTVLIPAIGGIFALRSNSRQGIFLLLFMVFSCAVMVNVKNGMNLRYATMWDMPLRYLAAGPILQLSAAVKRWPIAAAVVVLALVCGVELHQYAVIFVQHDVGDPITQFLMFSLEIVRPAPAH